MDGAEAAYSIGDLSAELGISPRALRLYEDQGLIAPRRVGGNRVYGPRERARLKLVLRGKRLGFSLAEIAELLDLYDVDPNHLEQLRRTLRKGRERIATLERQLAETSATLEELKALERHLVERIDTIAAALPEGAAGPSIERP